MVIPGVDGCVPLRLAELLSGTRVCGDGTCSPPELSELSTSSLLGRLSCTRR